MGVGCLGVPGGPRRLVGGWFLGIWRAVGEQDGQCSDSL